MSVTIRNPVRPHAPISASMTPPTATRADATPSRLAAIVAVYAMTYGVAQTATDMLGTQDGISIWFPPAAVTVLFLLAVPPRLGLPVVVVTRTAWALALVPGVEPPRVVASAVVVALVYTAAAQTLLRVADAHDTTPPSPRTVAAFFALVVGLAPLVAAFLTRVIAVMTGDLEWAAVPVAVRSFWIGDAVAIATLVPVPWAIRQLARAPRATRLGAPAAMAVTAVTAWAVIAVDFGGAAPLYVVLVPMVAAAVRYSLTGAALSVAGAGIGLTVALGTGGGATTIESAHAFLVVAALAAATVGSVEGRRRDNHDQLLVSEQQLREMIDAVQDYALYRLDPDGTIATWNAGARRLKGWEATEVIGQHFRVLHPPESRDAGVPDALLARAREEGIAHDEGWRMRRDGTSFWAEVTLTRIDHDGELAGFTKVTRDITPQKEAAERLARRTRELATTNEELDRFASVASHDLQEPLRMVTSYSRLLERQYHDGLDERGRQLLDHVVDGAQRMRVLIHDLLAYARLQSRDHDIVDVDLDQVVVDIRTVLALELERTGARLEVSDLPTLPGAPERLHAVMLNLLQNAIKYAGDRPPHVRVAAERDGHGWQVTVADDGVGIPEDMRDEVFEPFRRLHTRDEVAGTGIGLAICRRVVERRGGWIRAEGNPDGGTTMRVWLPDQPTPETTR